MPRETKADRARMEAYFRDLRARARGLGAGDLVRAMVDTNNPSVRGVYADELNRRFPAPAIAPVGTCGACGGPLETCDARGCR
jgi:hypothetical protein